MLLRIGQLDKKDMKNSAVSETTVTNGTRAVARRRTATPGRTLGIVGNSEDGDGLEGWRRSSPELDPGASSTVLGSMTGLQLIDCQSDIGSYELFDKECSRLEQFTSIDY